MGGGASMNIWGVVDMGGGSSMKSRDAVDMEHEKLGSGGYGKVLT